MNTVRDAHRVRGVVSVTRWQYRATNNDEAYCSGTKMSARHIKNPNTHTAMRLQSTYH